MAFDYRPLATHVAQLLHHFLEKQCTLHWSYSRWNTQPYLCRQPVKQEGSPPYSMHTSGIALLTQFLANVISLHQAPYSPAFRNISHLMSPCWLLTHIPPSSSSFSSSLSRHSALEVLHSFSHILIRYLEPVGLFTNHTTFCFGLFPALTNT